MDVVSCQAPCATLRCMVATTRVRDVLHGSEHLHTAACYSVRRCLLVSQESYTVTSLAQEQGRYQQALEMHMKSLEIKMHPSIFKCIYLHQRLCLYEVYVGMNADVALCSGQSALGLI